jgi:hypothetical protein
MFDVLSPKGTGTFGTEGKDGIVRARGGKEESEETKNNTIEASMLLKTQGGKREQLKRS